ncbi:MAG: HIRAN domain-containing protein [Devosia sp.]
MQRRSFIAAAGAAGVLAPGLATAKARPSGASKTALFDARLVNVSPDGGQEEAGTSFELRRWPERRFDAGSVAAVSQRGKPLGFLPRDMARVVGPLLDHGLILEGKLLSRRVAPRPGLYVEVRLAD